MKRMKEDVVSVDEGFVLLEPVFNYFIPIIYCCTFKKFGSL